MKQSTRRKSSILPIEARNVSRNFSTKFSLPTFVKRVSKLTDNQRLAVKRMGFGSLLQITNKMLRRNLLAELMERWSCEKRAFVLLPGEIKITLMDVVLILGLRVTGDPVILKEDAPFLDLEKEYGAALWNRKITVSSIEERLDSLGEADDEYFTRSFLLFTFGIFLFPNANGKVDSRFLSFLYDLDKVSSFAWGAAVLEDIINWLCRRKDANAQCIGGCLIFLQIWSYEHINLARPGLLSILTFPRVCRWGNIKSSERESFNLKFQELNINQIVWELQLSSQESEIDIIQEILETRTEKESEIDIIQEILETRTEKEDNIRSKPEVEQGVLDMETESDMELVDEIHGAQDDSSKQLRLSRNASIVSINSAKFPHTSHDREQKEQGKHPRVKQVTSTVVIISDDEGDLDVMNQVVEEPKSKLKKEIVDLKNENEFLKNQLMLSSQFEDQNVELRKEVEDLRRENQQLRSSTCLLARLESFVLDEHENTAGEQATKYEDFVLHS